MTTTLSNSIKEQLRWTPLMAGLSPEQVESLIEFGSIIEYKLGDEIDFGKEDSPALCVILEGGARLADSSKASMENTLFMLSEKGSFIGSEVLRRSGLQELELISSGDAKVLRLSGSVLTQAIANSKYLNDKLDQEAQLLYSFYRLRSAPRFRNLDYWRFRPVLSRGKCSKYSASESCTGSRGLSIVLSGTIATDSTSNNPFLKAGDWFAHGHIFPGVMNEPAGEYAIEQSELFQISEDAYNKIRELSPELISQMDLLLHNCNSDGQIIGLGSGESHTYIAATEAYSNTCVTIEDEPLVPKLNRMLKMYPVLRQHSELECGITCLQLLSIFYGKKVSLTQLRELCEIGRSGTSMLQLAEAAEQLGFLSRGIRATFAGLSKLRLPLILYWKGNHFVVLYELHEKHAVIGDPAQGLITIDVDRFNKEYSEHALELTPTVQWFEQKVQHTPLLNTMLPILRPHKRLLLDVLGTSLIFELLLLVSPVFTQIVIDQVIVHQDLDTLNILLLGMIMLSIFQGALTYVRQFFLAFLALKLDQSLFTHLFKKLLSLPLEYFNKHSTGDLLTRFSEGSSVVQFLTGMGAMTLLDLAMAIVFLAVVFFYSVKLGIAAIAYVTVYAAFLAIYTPQLRKLSQSAYDKQVAAESFLVEAIRGIERVKSAAAEQRTRWRWDSLFLDKLNIRFQESLTVTTASAVIRVIQMLGQVLFLFLGAQMVIGKELTLGQLMSVTMLVSMITAPILRLVDLSEMFQTVCVAIERFNEILTGKAEEPDPTAKIQLHSIAGHIKLEKVTFRYPGRESNNAIANISFEASPGQMIGIVGRSGSGKSTLTKLIQGLYLPAEGHVIIDGNDLCQVSLTSYRRKIGVVSQTEYFFRGTIRENIAFHKPDASLQEIINACTIAGINEMISNLPSGYETVLSEGADNFSGGQRQCMAIARALLHKPSILIFDEATSAMDSETEHRIQDCMEKLRHDSTIFVVAHRLSTVTSADKILVMDQGQLLESGTHEELLKEKGLYYYLCKKQSL